MTQQNSNTRRRFDLPRFKRKLSRANINVLNFIDALPAGVPREVRLVSIDDGRIIKPTVLVELPVVGDEDQE